MPYIDRENRRHFANGGHARTVGELTYALTKTVVTYLDEIGPPFEVGFSDYAEAIAALEATKLELYRRAIAPYEDEKCHKNGDVYPKPAFPREAVPYA